MLHFVSTHASTETFEKIAAGYSTWQTWLPAKAGLNYFGIEIPVFDLRLAQSVHETERALKKYGSVKEMIKKNPNYLRNVILRLEISLLQLRFGDVLRDARAACDAEMGFDEAMWDLGVETQAVMRCQTFLCVLAATRFHFSQVSLTFWKNKW